MFYIWSDNLHCRLSQLMLLNTFTFRSFWLSLYGGCLHNLSCCSEILQNLCIYIYIYMYMYVKRSPPSNKKKNHRYLHQRFSLILSVPLQTPNPHHKIFLNYQATVIVSAILYIQDPRAGKFFLLHSGHQALLLTAKFQ